MLLSTISISCFSWCGNNQGWQVELELVTKESTATRGKKWKPSKTALTQRIWELEKTPSLHGVCMVAMTENEHMLCFLPQFSCSECPSSMRWLSCRRGNAHFHSNRYWWWQNLLGHLPLTGMARWLVWEPCETKKAWYLTHYFVHDKKHIICSIWRVRIELTHSSRGWCSKMLFLRGWQALSQPDLGTLSASHAASGSAAVLWWRSAQHSFQYTDALHWLISFQLSKLNVTCKCAWSHVCSHQ